MPAECLTSPSLRVLLYRGTSPIRKRTPLGPCRGNMPRVIGGSSGDGRFLMSEVSLYSLPGAVLALVTHFFVKALWCFTLFGERRPLMGSNSAGCLCNSVWSARKSQVDDPNSMLTTRIRGPLTQPPAFPHPSRKKA